MGEQSVSAIIPKFRSVTSGASDALPAVAAQPREPTADQIAAAPTPVAARARNWRRLSEAVAGRLDDPAKVWRGDEFIQVVLVQGIAKEVLAKQAAG